MRAVVLGKPKIIRHLNEKFINVWCLNSELKHRRDHLGMSELPPLMQAIIKGWKAKSPVDSLVISPQLKLLGRQPANDLIMGQAGPTPDGKYDMAAAYERFLENSLAGEEPGVAHNAAQQNRLTIEMVGPAEFKINGKGPLTAKGARKEVVRVAHGKKSILVWLPPKPATVSEDDYNGFKESLHNDGGMLEGLDIKGTVEFSSG